MRLERIEPEKPVFTCKCIACGKSLISGTNIIFADLDGEPFKAYYCYLCVDVDAIQSIQIRRRVI